MTREEFERIDAIERERSLAAERTLSPEGRTLPTCASCQEPFIPVQWGVDRVCGDCHLKEPQK